MDLAILALQLVNALKKKTGHGLVYSGMRLAVAAAIDLAVESNYEPPLPSGRT